MQQGLPAVANLKNINLHHPALHAIFHHRSWIQGIFDLVECFSPLFSSSSLAKTGVSIAFSHNFIINLSIMTNLRWYIWVNELGWRATLLGAQCWSQRDAKITWLWLKGKVAKKKECAIETVLGLKTWGCYTIKTTHTGYIGVWCLFGLHFHNTITCWLENFWAPRVSSILAFLIGIKQRREWGLPKAREMHRILYFHYSVALTCWTVFSLNGIPMNDSLIFLWPFQIPRDDLKNEKTTNNRCLNEKLQFLCTSCIVVCSPPGKIGCMVPTGRTLHTYTYTHIHIYIYTHQTPALSINTSEINT